MASNRYTKEEIIEAVKTSKSYSEVCRKLGLSPRGGNPTTIKRKIEEYGLDISHFTFGAWAKGSTADTDCRIRKKDINEILIENSGWTSHSIKNRLLKEGLKEYKCESCGLSSWGGYPIPLELHHINGIHTDNRLENLLILCPNCHAMTESFSKIKLSAQKETSEVEHRKFKEPSTINNCGNLELSQRYLESAETIHGEPKTKKDKKDRGKVHEHVCPQCGKTFLGRKDAVFCSNKCSQDSRSSKCSKEQLISDFKELHSYSAIGRKYNVSDGAIKKWVISYDILDDIYPFISHKVKVKK